MALEDTIITTGATIGNAILQNSLNKQNLREQRAYEAKVRREQNAYNSAQAVKNRLMMAGATDTQALYSTMGYQPAPVSDFQQGLQYEATGLDASAIGNAVASDQATALGMANLDAQNTQWATENAMQLQLNEQTIANIQSEIKQRTLEMNQSKDKFELEQTFRRLSNQGLDLENQGKAYQAMLAYAALMSDPRVYQDDDGFHLDADALKDYQETALMVLEAQYESALGEKETARQQAHATLNNTIALTNLASKQAREAFLKGDLAELQKLREEAYQDARKRGLSDKDAKDAVWLLDLGIDIMQPINSSMGVSGPFGIGYNQSEQIPLINYIYGAMHSPAPPTNKGNSHNAIEVNASKYPYRGHM